ncbi:MAG TPA: Npt1/Npt2 family nucleotide transporter [Candidatus Rifleibacterium sp.]|nr:Npt1/Npt2 family nucleotide transporter [Candidatus Rifleibacterium sp.]
MTSNDQSDDSSRQRQSSAEIKVTLVSLAYFFFVICSYYVIKPVRESLALELGSENIPLLNIVSMASLVLVNALYSVIVGHFKRDIFIPFITRFFAVSLIGFWILFSFVIPMPGSEAPSTMRQESTAMPANPARLLVASGSQPVEAVDQPPSAAVAPCSHFPAVRRPELSWFKIIAISTYYLWVNMFSLMAVSMFWSFMNDVFSVGQSKRLYAIIGYGGLIGGLVGSSLTSLLVRHTGTPNLFILAMIFLYPSIWCMQYIHRNHYRPEGIPEADRKPVVPAHPPRPWDGFLAVGKNYILLLMALEMFFYTFSATLFSQQFNHLVENELGNINERTAFVAGIYGYINIVSLVTQFLVTRLMMLFANPILGLLMLNFIQVAGTLLMLRQPSLTIISWTIIIRYALNYSTGRVLRELIYIPLDREAKYQGKGFIDTVVFRFGDGLSSAVIFGVLGFYHYGPWIDYSILAVMAMQFYVIIKAAGLYAQRLQQTGTGTTTPTGATS